MTAIPAQVLEVRNGILMVILACMLVGDLAYVVDELRQMGFRNVYRYRKAAIAMAFFLAGLLTQTGMIWAARHMENHGYAPPLAARFGPLVLTAGSVLAVVGGLCWLRVTLPRQLPPYLWVMIGFAAVAFGVGMALP